MDCRWGVVGGGGEEEESRRGEEEERSSRESDMDVTAEYNTCTYANS